MSDTASEQPARVVRLDDVDRIPLGPTFWRPVRRLLGVTAFGINAYTADNAGDEVIERHDEMSPGAGRHEEVYVVLSGHVSFTVGAEEIDCPVGTMLLVEPGVERRAIAREPDSTVLVIGGAPGSALPVSPFEFWYAAEPAYQAGDYERAIEIASEGLRDWPDNSRLRYQLACYHALAGHRDAALDHLNRALAADPSLARWATTDDDLASIRVGIDLT